MSSEDAKNALDRLDPDVKDLNSILDILIQRVPNDVIRAIDAVQNSRAERIRSLEKENAKLNAALNERFHP